MQENFLCGGCWGLYDIGGAVSEKGFESVCWDKLFERVIRWKWLARFVGVMTFIDAWDLCCLINWGLCRKIKNS